MRAKAITAAVAIGAIAVAYVIGYWPERRARTAAESQVQELQMRLDAAEARLRTGEILGRTLVLKEVAARMNYGQARDMASPLFDALRQEASRTSDNALKAVLNELLGMRDPVTAALATADPAVVDSIHQMELRLRAALGYAAAP